MMPSLLFVIWSITVVVLVSLLILNERRHSKIEMALLDRVLQASGNRGVMESPVKEPVKIPEKPKHKLLFPVRA